MIAPISKIQLYSLRLFIFIFTSVLLCSSCKKEAASNAGDSDKLKLFKSMPSSVTGITFNNKLTETEEENVLFYDSYYTGSGTAILDVNNDGLQDVFFASNQGPEKLYLNKGNFKFEDIPNLRALKEEINGPGELLQQM